jgi:SAM-dependent methyltransferase
LVKGKNNKMSKIYLYFQFVDKKEREGYKSMDMFSMGACDKESIEEITGEGILEKTLSLIDLIEDCYQILKPGGTCTFTAPYYASFQAWQDPRNIRGISQSSLNFADKNWREQNGCPDLAKCDFEVGCNFAIDQTAVQRSEAAKEFWLNRYTNVVQSVMFTLKKR